MVPDDEVELCACGAEPGTPHDPECDHARCPECGEQAGTCGHDSRRPALWHGVDQRAEVARMRGWWTTAAGIDHLVEDYTRVLFAAGLGMIIWNPAAQRYAIGDIDETRLETALRSG